MIVLDKADLRSQEGMERALAGYFAYAREHFEGTFNGMLGAEPISCDYEKKTLLCAVETKDWMTNPSRMVHGGVTASVLDFTMGLLARYATTGCMTPTISMNVEYLRPSPLNRRILVEAQVTRAGFTVCHVTAKAWAEGAEDKLIATASGAYYVTRRPD